MSISSPNPDLTTLAILLRTPISSQSFFTGSGIFYSISMILTLAILTVDGPFFGLFV